MAAPVIELVRRREAASAASPKRITVHHVDDLIDAITSDLGELAFLRELHRIIGTGVEARNLVEQIRIQLEARKLSAEAALGSLDEYTGFAAQLGGLQ
jgi:hypothetical protein